jgi:hypothetical protein
VNLSEMHESVYVSWEGSYGTNLVSILMQSSFAWSVVATGDDSRLLPGMCDVPPGLVGRTEHGEERCSPGVTVRIVDRIALPSVLIELGLLCALCAAALGARREQGL